MSGAHRRRVRYAHPRVGRWTVAGALVLGALLAPFGHVVPPDPPEVRQVVIPAAVVSPGTQPGHCAVTR